MLLLLQLVLSSLKFTESIHQSSCQGNCIAQSELDLFVGQYFHSTISLAVHLDAMQYTHIQTNIQLLILVIREGQERGRGGVIRGK